MRLVQVSVVMLLAGTVWAAELTDTQLSPFEAARQWRYTPAYLDGAPVPVIMTVTANFRLPGR